MSNQFGPGPRQRTYLYVGAFMVIAGLFAATAALISPNGPVWWEFIVSFASVLIGASYVEKWRRADHE